MQYRLSWVLPLLLVGADADAAAVSGETASRLVESPLSAANLLQTAGGLLLVIAVMLALAWLVKRFIQLPGVGKGQVQIIGGISLGAREKAVLLSVEGRRLLVGVAPGRVQTLLELGDSSDSEPSFDKRLHEASAAADVRGSEASS